MACAWELQNARRTDLPRKLDDFRQIVLKFMTIWSIRDHHCTIRYQQRAKAR
jgi:hypothetical protein